VVEPKAFQDALLAYHARPCDAEAEAVRAAVAQDERERCAQLVPTSWLDPLLTGPRAVIGKPPYNCPDIERLLSAVAAAIRAGNGGVKEEQHG
jgi:hypothetical protein